MKKRTIILSAAAVLAAAAVIITAVVIISGSSRATKSKSDPDISGLEQPKQITNLLKDLYPTAPSQSASEQSLPGTGSEEDEEEIAYNASNIPEVTELMRLGGQADSINLVWRETNGVKGYRVYRKASGVKDAVYTLFSTVKRANLEIRNLKAGSKYDFKVVAFISDDYGTYEGKGAEATFATEPAKVSGLTLAEVDGNNTTISWKKMNNADGYIVKRCFSGKWSDYDTFDADTTEFTDEELESGRAYYYRVSAFIKDSSGTLEGGSKDIHTIAGMTAPEDTGSVTRVGRVSLDYSASPYADGYKIYLSEDNKKWELLDDIEETYYNTDRLEEADTYYFRVTPYRNVGKIEVNGPYLALTFTAGEDLYDKEVGDTYIEVSLADQHMWYIKDGAVYLDSDVVSGNRNSMDTPTGTYSILSKASPCTLVGADYVSYVDYWMAFIGGSYGLHDASWRSSFGGDIYESDGSHGCVNLPSEVAKKLYATAEVGTPVIVY